MPILAIPRMNNAVNLRFRSNDRSNSFRVRAGVIHQQVATRRHERMTAMVGQLRKLGAVGLAWETKPDDLYRFQCHVQEDQEEQFARQFSAVHNQPEKAIEQVLDELTTWRRVAVGGRIKPVTRR